MATQAAKPAKARRRPRRDPCPDTPDAVDLAMRAAGSDQPIPELARRVLEEHAKLTRAQREELRLRKVGEAVRAALWAILALLALATVAAIVAVIIRAARTDALVVQSFEVPPALQSSGLTGKVVATQVLDKLSQIQEESQSARSPSSYANNWEEDLKIDIPNTGATAEQVWKLLRSSLGKETRISGEVIQTRDGMALTARVGSQPAGRFVSRTGDLDALVNQAAELIYRQTQPYRYSVWLTSKPYRLFEIGPILEPLTRHPSAIERKWAFNGLGAQRRLLGDFQGSVTYAERAIAVDPRFPTGVANLAVTHLFLGHDQTVVDLFRRQQQFPTDDEYDQRILVPNQCRLQVDAAFILRDPPQMSQAISCMQASTFWGAAAPFWRARTDLARHDPRLGLAFRGKTSLINPAVNGPFDTGLMQLLVQMEHGPSPALDRALDGYVTARTERAATNPYPIFKASLPRLEWPREAEALAMLGRAPEAQVLIAKTPLDCYYCVRVRGLVAQASGEPQAAQRWFAEAVRQGPSLPAAYLDWARLLAQHRRFASAERRFERAADLAPNWADPLKYWGDALAAEGRRNDALEKYGAASKLAPRWDELRRARAALSAR